MSKLFIVALVWLCFMGLALFGGYHRHFALPIVFAVSALAGVAIGTLFALASDSNLTFALLWTALFSVMLATIMTLFSSVGRRSSS